jgi:prepilin signal peptidase PulO-like enzyme (type II secretory pathway)
MLSVPFSILGWLVGWLIHQAAYYLPVYLNKVQRMRPYPKNSALCLVMIGADDCYPQHDIYLVFLFELGTAYCFGVMGIFFPIESSLTLMLAYSFFCLIALIDVRYRLILNVMSYPAMLVVFAGHLLFNDQPLLNVLLGIGLVFAIFAFTAFIRPNQLGSGDIKLASLLGLCFGFPNVLWALILGAGLGGIVAVGMLLTGRYSLKTRIPYAPFLCFGALSFLVYQSLV